MNYPIKVTKENIEKYENFLEISINVYELIERRLKIDLRYRSKKYKKFSKHIDILYCIKNIL